MRGHLGKGGVLRKKTLLGFRKNGLPIYLAQGGAPDEVEVIRARQSELLDLMEAANKDASDETRSAEQRAADGRTFDEYDAEFRKNEEEEKRLLAIVEERQKREERVRSARSHYGSVQVKPGRSSETDFYNDVDYRFMGGEGDHERWLERADRLLDDGNKATRHLQSRKNVKTGATLPDRRDAIRSVLRTKDGDTDGELIAAFMIATSNPHYRSAFQKASAGIAPIFSPEEARAVRDVNNIKRAMSVGTPASGGFAVPVVIDPTIIMTAQGSENPILQRARVETITVDTWKGLSSAGSTWKFGAEASAASDNSPTIAQPEVATHRADGFIPFSIEIGMDWPGFAERMSDMLGSGYDELLAEKLTTGTGADNPVGLLSRLAAQTSPDVSTEVAVAGAIAPGDIYDLWARLPQRHRRRGAVSWMSSTRTQNAVRQLGTLDPNFTVDMSSEDIGLLMGHPYDQNDYFADFAAGTGTQNWLVAGSFQGYLVAQRAGMNVEFVPMLFDVTNNRPTGQRGWFAWARIGADVVDPTAFQLLTNRSA